MTNVEALKTLYVAMGGQASDVADLNTSADIIAKMASVATPAELPAVTSADNGKVLTVSGGKWVAAAVPAELPAVTADDNGDVLTVADGVWKAVTPTP